MEMIEKRVSELEGPALDWAVSKATGIDIKIDRFWGDENLRCIVEPTGSAFRPSESWCEGGPLIDRFDIGFIRVGDTIFATTDASDWDYSGFLGGETGGSTRLIAAMRAIVVAVLGEVVKVPAALVGGGDA